MSMEDMPPNNPDEPSPPTDPFPEAEATSSSGLDELPLASECPYIDWDLLRASQAISRQLGRPSEPVYRILDPFCRIL